MTIEQVLLDTFNPIGLADIVPDLLYYYYNDLVNAQKQRYSLVVSSICLLTYKIKRDLRDEDYNENKFTYYNDHGIWRLAAISKSEKIETKLRVLKGLPMHKNHYTHHRNLNSSLFEFYLLTYDITEIDRVMMKPWDTLKTINGRYPTPLGRESLRSFTSFNSDKL